MPSQRRHVAALTTPTPSPRTASFSTAEGVDTSQCGAPAPGRPERSASSAALSPVPSGSAMRSMPTSSSGRILRRAAQG